MKRLLPTLLALVLLPVATLAAPPSLYPEDLFLWRSNDSASSRTISSSLWGNQLKEDVVITNVFANAHLVGVGDSSLAHCQIAVEILDSYDVNAMTGTWVSRLASVRDYGAGTSVTLPLQELHVPAGYWLAIRRNHYSMDSNQRCAHNVNVQGYYAK